MNSDENVTHWPCTVIGSGGTLGREPSPEAVAEFTEDPVHIVEGLNQGTPPRTRIKIEALSRAGQGSRRGNLFSSAKHYQSACDTGAEETTWQSSSKTMWRRRGGDWQQVTASNP